MENKDPILSALARIEAKQDQVLAKQDVLDKEIGFIRQDCETIARKNALVAGGVAGGVVSTGILLIKAKLGL